MHRKRETLSSSLLRPWLVQLALLVCELSSNSFGGSVVAEILSILHFLIDEKIVLCLPFVLFIGWLVKSKTRIPNGYIPSILLLLSISVGSAYGIACYAAGIISIWEGLLVYGFGQGYILASEAVFLHSALHGIRKSRREKRELTKIHQGEDCMKKLKDRFKSAWLKVRYKSITAYLMQIAASLVAWGIYYIIAEGTTGLADSLTTVAIIAVLSCIFVDMFLKVLKTPLLVIKSYWAVIGTELLAVGTLVWAFGADTILLQGIGLGAVLVLSIVSFVLYKWVYCPRFKKREEEIEELAIKHLVENSNLDASIAMRIVKESWVGAEVEAKILNQGITGEVK